MHKQKPERLILSIMATECANRCRHCWAQGHPPLAPMKLDLVRHIVNQFEEYAPSAGFSNLLVMLMDDIWCHPQALDLWRFQRDYNHGVVEKGIITNGQVLARHPRYLKFLQDVKLEGISSARLSLHGLEEEHDWFVQRAGAYADLMETATRLDRSGIKVEWNIYPNTRNVHQFQAMVNVLRSVTDDHDPLLNITIPTWVPNQRLMDYEPLRLSFEDTKKVDFNVGGSIHIPNFLHEGEVTEAIHLGRHNLVYMEQDYMTYRRQGKRVSVTCDGNLDVYEGPSGNYEHYHGNLNTHGIKAVMGSIVGYEPTPLPSLNVLANLYGDTKCPKVHGSDISILRKWLAMYWFEHLKDHAIPHGIDSMLYALA